MYRSKMLRSDATYLLIGGTGGIGRSIARWMISEGARNVVLVSRTGSTTGKVKELVDEAGTIGANVIVRRCDVANAESVNALIDQGLTNMPAIRGVVHGAMVLHVSLSSLFQHCTNRK